jgi:outer membrane cobalamin receptor
MAGLLVGSASAQTEQPAPPPSSANVPTFRTDVVVTAERGETEQEWIPAATMAVDAATLRTWPALTLGEFLSFVPGFRVQQPALFAGRPVVSARGFFGGGEAEYVALLVDGVRVADAESGLVDWSTISGSTVTRIDAVRGPGASLYGDAAIGGVIQVLTDSPATGDVFTFSGGSLGTFSIDGASRWSRARSEVSSRERHDARTEFQITRTRRNSRSGPLLAESSAACHGGGPQTLSIEISRILES